MPHDDHRLGIEAADKDEVNVIERQEREDDEEHWSLCSTLLTYFVAAVPVVSRLTAASYSSARPLAPPCN